MISTKSTTIWSRPSWVYSPVTLEQLHTNSTNLRHSLILFTDCIFYFSFIYFSSLTQPHRSLREPYCELRVTCKKLNIQTKHSSSLQTEFHKSFNFLTCGWLFSFSIPSLKFPFRSWMFEPSFYRKSFKPALTFPCKSSVDSKNLLTLSTVWWAVFLMWEDSSMNPEATWDAKCSISVRVWLYFRI
jgi:hypothetical protein